MFVIQFLEKNRVARMSLVGLVLGIVLFTLVATIYVRFHYAAVMPRSPQTAAGRIYPIPAQYGGMVYVNRRELERRDFVKYDLTTASGVGMLILALLGARLGWFESGTRFRGTPRFPK
jgi:hypothetical protein